MNNKLAAKLEKQVLAFLKKRQQITNKRKADIEKAFCEKNSDLAPVLDSKGRYHAPCDGYALPILASVDYNDGYEGRIFGKGEFLPIPVDLEGEIILGSGSTSNFEYTGRIMLEGDDLAAVCALKLRGTTLEAGQSWISDTTKNKTAYVYIKAYSKELRNLVVELIKQHFEDVKNKQKEAAKKAKGIAPSGDKIKVRGTVLAIKSQDGYAYNSVDWKMLVELENKSTVWGSIPNGILTPVQKGMVVEFTANFEQSEEDKTHAFYKRPTKCRIVLKAPKWSSAVWIRNNQSILFVKTFKTKSEATALLLGGEGNKFTLPQEKFQRYEVIDDKSKVFLIER